MDHLTSDQPRLAAILAGGRATRLDGVEDKPKCLIEIQGRPLIDYQADLLRRHGVSEIVLLLGHKSQQVIDYVGEGAAGLRVRYSVEKTPLGTAGAVKHAQHLLDGPFLLLNGDTLVDVDLRALWRAHEAHADASATLALCEMADTRDYGSVELDASGRVLAFREKQATSEPGFVNAGVYCISPRALQGIPANTPYSVETQWLPSLVQGGEAVYGYPFRGEFLDIGTPQRLHHAQHHPLFQR